MSLYMGIDGGGSNLRVALTDAALTPLAQVTGAAANPSPIGREEAARRIQTAIAGTLQAANVTAAEVRAAGIGIAGASNTHAEAWLRDVVSAVLPDTTVVPSSDFEIALVGARGEHRGVLILAGTGSVAFGVNAAGDCAQAGGWGYLLGDEGAGYWIGLEALKAYIEVTDGTWTADPVLHDRIQLELGLTDPRELIAWMYRQPPPVKEVAALAEIVLREAERGDRQAGAILEAAADHLFVLVSAIKRRLNAPDLPVAFAGGLLTSANPLSRRLCDLLHLADIPQSRYPPVIGAALLAQLKG